nr:MAG TPA: hypothetical protein [Caudoviricetes sp.]DAZ79679.1 MAG TPA: hypothetical protein [Caudoviricetes sp.]
MSILAVTSFLLGFKLFYLIHKPLANIQLSMCENRL